MCSQEMKSKEEESAGVYTNILQVWAALRRKHSSKGLKDIREGALQIIGGMIPHWWDQQVQRS